MPRGVSTRFTFDPLNDISPVWSPDGRFIVYYATLPTAGWDVMVLPLSGERKPIALSQTKFAEVAGRFAPSGRWIA